MTGPLPPGPRGVALLRAFADRRRDPVGLLLRLRREHGEIVHVRVGDTSQFVVSGLADIQHVLVDNHRNYTKGPAYALLAEILGRGLVTSEGEHWRRHRRLVQPSLQRERMRAFAALMAHAAGEEAERWTAAARQRRTVDVYEEMMALAVRIVARTLLGGEVGGREHAVHAALTEIFDGIERLSTSPLRLLEMLPGGSRLRGVSRRLATLPLGAHRRFRAAIATLDVLIFEVIARRRAALAADAPPTDLVSRLLRAGETDGEEPLTDEEIRDEVMTMFLAGHETTATALTWCIRCLVLHPEYAERIAAEAHAVLGSRPATLEDLPHLVTAERVFAEAMRLYPPIWRISRFASERDIVGGYDVPPGSVVVVSPYVVHRDPAWWHEPERFDPERFAPERAHGRPRLAYMPFGAGQRMCLGAAFATAEAQIILSALCRAVHLTLPDGANEVRFAPRVTLRPHGGMPVRLLSRSAPNPAVRA